MISFRMKRWKKWFNGNDFPFLQPCISLTHISVQLSECASKKWFNYALFIQNKREFFIPYSMWGLNSHKKKWIL